MKEQLKETTKYLRDNGFETPEIGIVLGTGLGNLVNAVDVIKTIAYQNIPHFPEATVETHSGKLIYGTLGHKKVVIMQGRFHRYEGYTLQQITYPIRVMHQLGIQHLLISNACGALNVGFKKGSLMLLTDHINLQGGSPLAFKGVEHLGERFVDMCEPYDVAMREKIRAIAKAQQITLHQGVYAAVVGPQLETKAEYRYLKTIGADVVGMSTVPEVIVANHLKLPCLAVSVITDECNPDDLKPIDIPEIFALAEKAQEDLVPLFKSLTEKL